MNLKSLKRGMLHVLVPAFALAAVLAVPGVPASTAPAGQQEDEEISDELRDAILAPIKQRRIGWFQFHVLWFIAMMLRVRKGSDGPVVTTEYQL